MHKILFKLTKNRYLFGFFEILKQAFNNFLIKNNRKITTQLL
jgi:hypothetical protein